jgi:hypothetical protein
LVGWIDWVATEVVKEKKMRETVFNQVLDKVYLKADEMRCVHPSL